MADSHSRQLFLNLAVRDLKKSMTFFSTLGFEFNPKFTNDDAACMIVGNGSFVMLLTQPYFKTFTRREPCDTTTHSEGLFAVSCGSRAEVDEMAGRAMSAGAQHAMDPQDHGFMYVKTFYDLDGHHWEVFWMDPKAAE